MDQQNKRKSYHSNQFNKNKKKRQFSLECGMKGFLCTCNFREKDCIREALNILNVHAEKLKESDVKQVCKNYPLLILIIKKFKKQVNNEVENNVFAKLENASTKSIEGKEDQSEVTVESNNEQTNESYEEEADEDVLNSLNSEIDSLKAEKTENSSKKDFQIIDTNVPNLIFIRSYNHDPLELCESIINDVFKTKIQKTRYLLRMLPIQIVCKPYLDDIKSKADSLFSKYFIQEPKNFCIVFNRHSNSNLDRNEVIEELANLIFKKNPGNKVNLKNPEVAVVIEVVRANCLLAIAPNYFTYKKYNLLELCNKT